MSWFIGRAGYALFDVWSIVHFCFWVFVGSNIWAMKIARAPAMLACMCLALLWEVFERPAEIKWPNLWLTPESWWNAWVSDPLTCAAGILFIWYALDNWRLSPMSILFTLTVLKSMGEELTKIAVSNKLMGNLVAAADNDPEEAKKLLTILYRSVGARPPSTSHTILNENFAKQVKGSLRKWNKADDLVPEVAPFGTPEWRQARRDIASGNMVTMHTGLDASHVPSISQFGPASPMAPSNLPGAHKWQRDITSRAKAMKDVDVSDRISEAGMQGIFAVHAPEGGFVGRGTHYYANRAGDNPTLLSFKLPASMMHNDTDVEARIPRKMYMRWARDQKTQSLKLVCPNTRNQPWSSSAFPHVRRTLSPSSSGG